MIAPFVSLLQARDPDFSLEGLIKLAILFLFFILPVISSIVKKTRETLSRPPAPGESGPQPMSQDELQRNLERKLREMLGEARAEPEVAEAPPPPPPPPRPRVQAPKPSQRATNRPPRAPKPPKRSNIHVEDYAESIGAHADRLSHGPPGRLSIAGAMQTTNVRGGSHALPPGAAVLTALRKSPESRRNAILLGEILGPPKALRDEA